eukprot:m.100716 g.100716  ORF g.100716 m.100716 type:complete len:126 (+) comp12554_c0_seq12:430-807(+)
MHTLTTTHTHSCNSHSHKYACDIDRNYIINTAIIHNGGFFHRAAGYGVCHIPMSPGEHHLECSCWKPVGEGDFARKHVGGSLRLRHEEAVYNQYDRSKLRTVTTGVVKVTCNVLQRGFDEFGVET